MKLAPGSLPLGEARRKARIELTRVDAGNDPAPAKAEARTAWTLAEAAAAYTATPEFRRRPERSQREDKAVLTLHVVHPLGREKLRNLDVPMQRGLRIESDTRTQLLNRHAPIATELTPSNRLGTPVGWCCRKRTPAACQAPRSHLSDRPRLCQPRRSCIPRPLRRTCCAG